MERPSIRVSIDEQDEGIYHLQVNPVDALRRFRQHLDDQRPARLNFVLPTAADVSVRLDYGVTIDTVLADFGDIQGDVRSDDSAKTQIIDTTPL